MTEPYRREADVIAELVSHFGPGWIWPVPEADPDDASELQIIVQAPAQSLHRVEVRAAELMDEIDPRTAIVFLPDFERVLGPDPCGRAGQTVAERQRIAHQRWTAKGGQSIPYFLQQAAALGIEVEIDEFWPSDAGWLQAGDELIADGQQFTWVVRLTPTAAFDFNAGAAVAGDPLGWFELSDIECVFRRQKPAHSQVIYRYVETLDG